MRSRVLLRGSVTVDRMRRCGRDGLNRIGRGSCRRHPLRPCARRRPLGVRNGYKEVATSGPAPRPADRGGPVVDGVPVRYGPQRIIRVYVVTNALFTLAASLIWAINTLFLMRAGGMSLALVFVINAGFTASQAVCEVPTGVIADTLGRKLSFLLSIGTLIVSTLIYVLSA